MDEIFIRKANLSSTKQLLSGFLAGVYIAFGAQAANIVGSYTPNPGLIAGLIFPAGLILVVLAGAELFTGNCLMIMALLNKKISLAKLLRSWLVVYLGNLIGGVFIAYLLSGQLSAAVREYTIKVAVNKSSLSFTDAFIRGLLCNWLVCLAVFMSFKATDTIGKVAVLFFPVWVFIASGFEHSVANMYYIPAGIFAGGATCFDLIKNLIPVTLGNIVGGAGFVGIFYK
ncbi:MAG: formate/nitrite transporter family protein, partial [Synergistaceae bacterium]|nr:formate/nitrite transporter family protein [Synergistaceae bacterium]